MRSPAAVLGVAALVAGLSGCAAPAADRTAGVSVVVLQYRSDIAPRRVQLEVVNRSREPLVVAAAALTGAGYAPAPRWTDSVPAEIPAGATVDLPVLLTRATCSGPARPVVRVRLADRSTSPVPTADSHGTLAALRRGDCFAERAERAARISFAGFRETGRTAELTLRLTPGPRAAEGLRIEEVLPTTLLSPAGGAQEWPVDRRYTGAGRVVLRAVPTRCDLHAIAEDKVGTVLTARLRLADGTAGTVNAVASPTIRSRVQAWVVRACGTG